MIEGIIENIRKCDDFHNRCDYLLEHDEATHLLEYIDNIEEENKELHNKIEKVIEYIEENSTDYWNEDYTELRYRMINVENLLEILKEGDENV